MENPIRISFSPIVNKTEMIFVGANNRVRTHEHYQDT